MRTRHTSLSPYVEDNDAAARSLQQPWAEHYLLQKKSAGCLLMKCSHSFLSIFGSGKCERTGAAARTARMSLSLATKDRGMTCPKNDERPSFERMRTPQRRQSRGSVALLNCHASFAVLVVRVCCCSTNDWHAHSKLQAPQGPIGTHVRALYVRRDTTHAKQKCFRKSRLSCLCARILGVIKVGSAACVVLLFSSGTGLLDQGSAIKELFRHSTSTTVHISFGSPFASS